MKKILIADNILRAIEKEPSLLQRKNIKFVPVNSNKEALNIHRTEGADLIIVNFDAGDVSGEELCTIIRDAEELRSVSIIVAANGTPDEEICGNCRANELIRTPVNSPELFEKARKLLDIPSRATMRVPMGVKVQGADAKSSFVGFSDNISATGMLFESDRVLWEGLQMLCSFFLPDNTKVSTEAEVVRVALRKSEHELLQYGIRFQQLKEELRAAIEKYVRETSGEE